MNDLLIRNALVVDGSGAKPFHADLAVKDGLIATIGKDTSPTRETIDADGLALMPGIIDNHTHYDAQITWDASASPSPALGVTTAIIGNCGFTIAPCREADRDLILKNLTQVEGMSLEVLKAGTKWGFESVPEYFAMLEKQGVALNIAGFVGHSSVRTYVMGEDAPKRAATAAEVAKMRDIVLAGVKAGAVGFATSTSPNHNGHGGTPMPSRLADDAEMKALVGCLKEAGHGVFMLTKGGQTRIEFLEELAAASGRPVVVAALLHNNTNPHAVFDELERIAAANARGRRLYGAVSCCPLTMDFTLRSPYTFEGLAAWKPALSLTGPAYRAILGDAQFRDAVRREIAGPPVASRLFNGEWDKVYVENVAREENRRWQQQTVAELARATGVEPLDAMLDLALAEDLATEFSALLLNSDERAVGEMLRHPHSLVSLSDAGAHLTLFNDAGFGLHLLGRWVRELGVLSLESAVKKLTGDPAAVFGIQGRGALKPGHAADLMLFDPETVNRGPKIRVKDLPGGGTRLITPAVGVHGVWINGARVADEKGLRQLEKLSGRVLREFSA
ncbi:MAG: amidohydrolase family protein [Proteobacteria bacterium]|nr:amidohydrolase family protein [Pseudomonadota bacterium]MDA0982426.1 amidohydrolase family protein [Pseudomonadota bacterium]